MPITHPRALTRMGVVVALLATSSLLATPAGAARDAVATPAAQIIVSGFSEKGDFIDNGVSAVYSSHWSAVTATVAGISLVYRNAATQATYAFSPVAGESLAVGEYDNLQSAPSRSAGFAGIDITGPGEPAGCARLTGSFHIWDLASSAAGVITRLDLTYVEHCGAGRPANYGEVLINDAPRLGALIASANRIDFPDQTPTLPYVVTNPTSTPQSISLWQSATAVSYFHVSPVHAACATTVAAHSSCTYLIRLLPPKPGLYAASVLAVANGASARLSLSGPAGGV